MNSSALKGSRSSRNLLVICSWLYSAWCYYLLFSFRGMCNLPFYK